MYVNAVIKLHIFSIKVYFGTVFLRQCMCVCERYMLEIQYLLQIYNKKSLKLTKGIK